MANEVEMAGANLKVPPMAVTAEMRQALKGHGSAVLWFTGLSGSGKSATASAVEARLHAMGCHTVMLDGDHLRHGLCADLDFSPESRRENIRRTGEVAALFADAGIIVLAAFISPYADDRARVRKVVGEARFIEIHCASPLAVCEQRDVKGLYAKARAGQITDFTGVSSPYEAPAQPELVLDTAGQSTEVCAEAVIKLLHQRGIIASR